MLGQVLRQPTTRLELATEGRNERPVERRDGRHQVPEVLVGELQQARVPTGRDRGRARIPGHQGEFTDRRARTEHPQDLDLVVVDRSVRSLATNHRQTSGLDQVEGVPGVALAHKPLTRLDPNTLQSLLNQLPGIFGEAPEQGTLGEDRRSSLFI